MTYTILPGKHYSRPWRLRLYLFKKRWQWTCKFHDVRHKPDGSTHKLVGVGFGLNHHRNSIRVGWRYNSSTDLIELYSYAYIKGVRQEFKYIGSVAIGEQFEVKINKPSRFALLRVNKKNGMYSVTDFDMPRVGWFGYFLKPYFGGQATAPHEMKIEVR